MSSDDQKQLVSVQDVIFRAAQAASADYFEGPAADFIRRLQGAGYGPIHERARSSVMAELAGAAQKGAIEVFGTEQFGRREGLVPRADWRDGSLEYQPGGLALNGEGWSWTALTMKHRDANRLWPGFAPEPLDKSDSHAARRLLSAGIARNPATSADTGDEVIEAGWIRLRNGLRFVGRLWPESDERQRNEIIVTTLWRGTVPMRALLTVKPHDSDGQPMLPNLEREGALANTVPLPDIQVLLRMAPRLQTLDIPAGRIVISPIYDDKRFWGGFNWEPFFPGGATIPTRRFLTVELDDIEFDAEAARAYIVKNLLPSEATPSSAATATPIPIGAEGDVVLSPYRTGTADKPTSQPKRSPGPTPTAGRIQTASKRLFESGQIPGRTITWGKFQELVCKEIGVKANQRGYSLDTIQTALRPILLQLRERSDTGSTGN